MFAKILPAFIGLFGLLLFDEVELSPLPPAAAAARLVARDDIFGPRVISGAAWWIFFTLTICIHGCFLACAME